MPPWWAFVLFAVNVATLLYVVASAEFFREITEALRRIEKEVSDLVGRY